MGLLIRYFTSPFTLHTPPLPHSAVFSNCSANHLVTRHPATLALLRHQDGRIESHSPSGSFRGCGSYGVDRLPGTDLPTCNVLYIGLNIAY